MGILNKLQEKNLKTYKLDITNQTDPQMQETNQIIEKVEILLDDPRSPINSQLFAVS